ncbi:MAG: PAS domain S-box protein, partial [Bacteroidetes bacterium]
MAVHRAGRFIYLNPAAVRLLGGHSPDAFLGQPVLEVVAPEARARVKERLRQLYEERKPVPFLVERLVRRDGSSFLAEVKATPIDYGGEPAVLVVLRDVTEHVQERLDLIQSEARYRSLVEEINDVIFQLDARGCITFISPAVERLYG